jgi:hypothetical protein
MKIPAFVAMGLLMVASAASAQNAPTSGGSITIKTTGVEDVTSSKFTEYKDIPNGASISNFNLFSTTKQVDFNLTGQNVSLKNQRYFGSLKAMGLGVKFDYNQVPHNMGFDAHATLAESAPGVWTAPSTLRTALANAINAMMPTSTRTIPWYQGLFTPTFQAAGLVDITGVRKTGNVELDLGSHLPLPVTLSYTNTLKEGYRGLTSMNIRGALGPAMEAATPLDEMTHDIGIKTSYTFKHGSAYAGYNLSIYDNRAQSMLIDNLVQGVDQVQTAAVGSTVPAMGGPSRDRVVMAPDNEASTARAGVTFKFAKQTRISAGLALSMLTQDAPFFPYTAAAMNSSPSGLNLASRAALQQPSYGGKVNTTMYNFAFSSRPAEGLTLRAQYRVNDLKDKSDKYVITGDASQGNGAWTAVTATAADPFGHATANIYDTKSSRYSASATYDYQAFTIEGQVRGGQLERTHREAEKGTESGMGVTALYHYNDWLGFRGTYDFSKRTAEGETVYGFQLDEAAFENTKTGVEIELTPADGFDLSFAYFRRNVDFVDRPNRIAVSAGVPIAGAVATPNTPSGLLDTKYDSYTGEFNYVANARLTIGGFYTFEKDARTNQWSTTNSATAPVNPLKINNLLNYAGTDETNTYGANFTFQVVPERQTFSFAATSQRVDGLMDVTALETGTFYNPGRTTLIPAGQGGAGDLTDWDDTEITTLNASYNYVVTKDWAISAGYMFEKYDYKDPYNWNSSLMPTTLIFKMKPDDGKYTANLVYAKLTFKF